jgi:hypothetical protein
MVLLVAFLTQVVSVATYVTGLTGWQALPFV